MKPQKLSVKLKEKQIYPQSIIFTQKTHAVKITMTQRSVRRGNVVIIHSFTLLDFYLLFFKLLLFSKYILMLLWPSFPFSFATNFTNMKPILLHSTNTFQVTVMLIKKELLWYKASKIFYFLFLKLFTNILNNICC